MSVKTHTLPTIVSRPTRARGDRHGLKVERVVLHTWGGRYTTEPAEAVSYRAVISEFLNVANGASAHFVYPGSAVPNEITQMVDYADYAWTEAAYNPTSVEIECADAIWQGHDPDGLEQLAHITGYLLHRFRLQPVHEVNGGFCRHGDLGTAGGGHLFCPTADLAFFRAFGQKVAEHYHAGGYRKRWGT